MNVIIDSIATGRNIINIAANPSRAASHISNGALRLYKS